jgi:meso-butanediol dehydrogenase / (S,S)-butanediol dehydrogenase / diacetyl reductase
LPKCLGCRAAIPYLEKTKGTIINTASVSGTGGDWGHEPLQRGKGRRREPRPGLALDLGKNGIRVNSVCPSLTRTGMTENMLKDEKLVAKFKERIRFGSNLRTRRGGIRDRVSRE